MTDRLKSALTQLTPEQIEGVTRLAESLAGATGPESSRQGPGWTFAWAGALRDRPAQSGVEAQQAALDEWAEVAAPRTAVLESRMPVHTAMEPHDAI